MTLKTFGDAGKVFQAYVNGDTFVCIDRTAANLAVCLGLKVILNLKQSDIKYSADPYYLTNSRQVSFGKRRKVGVKQILKDIAFLKKKKVR
jgi:uridylate kinase